MSFFNVFYRQMQSRRSIKAINNWGYPDSFKPNTLLLTDGDHLLAREKKLLFRNPNTDHKNKHKVCCSSSHCLFTLGRVMSRQIRYFAVNVTKIH